MTQYRLSRAIGMLTSGMCFVGAGVVVLAWFLVAAFLGSSLPLHIVMSLLLALLLIIVLIVNLRPPVIFTLDPIGYRTRRDEGRWKDIQDVSLGDGFLSFTTTSGITSALPLNLIDGAKQHELVRDAYDRLNEAHGYKRFEFTE